MRPIGWQIAPVAAIATVLFLAGLIVGKLLGLI